MFIDDPLDPDKCFGREDVACQPALGVELCIPTCGSDSQCPAGRLCDPGLKVCVTTANMGLPTGDDCDPMMSACAGQCISFAGGLTACSTRCVLGGELVADDCGGLDQGLCAFLPSGNGAGDVGFCAEACTAHSDCQNPGFWCYDFGGGNNGYCFGADPCPNGQIDCGGGLTCTNTPYGPFCIDPTFPL
jgi:hypothetical protein